MHDADTGIMAAVPVLEFSGLGLAMQRSDSWAQAQELPPPRHRNVPITTDSALRLRRSNSPPVRRDDRDDCQRGQMQSTRRDDDSVPHRERDHGRREETDRTSRDNVAYGSGRSCHSTRRPPSPAGDWGASSEPGDVRWNPDKHPQHGYRDVDGGGPQRHGDAHRRDGLPDTNVWHVAP
jgi:hypothetical protein